MENLQELGKKVFFNAVENALGNGWASNKQEQEYWFDMLFDARNGNKDSLQLLRAEFKFFDAFKKETGAFQNV